MHPVKGCGKPGGQSPPAAALPFASAAPYILQATARRAERKPMSQKAMQRLSFFLLMGLTLYAAGMGAG